MPCCGEPNVLIALIAGPAGGRGSRRVFVFVVPSSVVECNLPHIFFTPGEKKYKEKRIFARVPATCTRDRSKTFLPPRIFFQRKARGGKAKQVFVLCPPSPLFLLPTTFSGGSRGLDRKNREGNNCFLPPLSLGGKERNDRDIKCFDD